MDCIVIMHIVFFMSVPGEDAEIVMLGRLSYKVRIMAIRGV